MSTDTLLVDVHQATLVVHQRLGLEAKRLAVSESFDIDPMPRAAHFRDFGAEFETLGWCCCLGRGFWCLCALPSKTGAHRRVIVLLRYCDY